MPEQINGETCLNMKEIEAHLGWTYDTVRKYLEESEFPFWTFRGKGRSKYYRKSDVDKLKEPRQSGTL